MNHANLTRLALTPARKFLPSGGKDHARKKPQIFASRREKGDQPLTHFSYRDEA